MTKDEKILVERVEAALKKQPANIYCTVSSGRAYLGTSHDVGERWSPDGLSQWLIMGELNANGGHVAEGWKNRSALVGLEVVYSSGLTVQYTGCRVVWITRNFPEHTMQVTFSFETSKVI